ncbi:hypothetical protein NDU88_004611 [Pleurodeles waltl]|uniref:Uncharacterized protein n=1 Tax=Pleurodeles waltl TaxID=8319 RepID=A0AAV7TS04_PLEWA|nr:hypothetical protein NDU88_004611 [Pleurodeles waltl]
MGPTSSPESARKGPSLHWPLMISGGPAQGPLPSTPGDTRPQDLLSPVSQSRRRPAEASRPGRGIPLGSSRVPRPDPDPGRRRRGQPNRRARPQAQQPAAPRSESPTRLVSGARRGSSAPPARHGPAPHSRRSFLHTAPKLLGLIPLGGDLRYPPDPSFWPGSPPHGVVTGEHRPRPPHSSGPDCLGAYFGVGFSPALWLSVQQYQQTLGGSFNLALRLCDGLAL